VSSLLSQTELLVSQDGLVIAVCCDVLLVVFVVVCEENRIVTWFE
jgi:hypothetical protein